MGTSAGRKAGQGSRVFIAGRHGVVGQYVARLVLRIDNYAHILRAYGQDAADTVVSWLREMVVEHFRGFAMAVAQDNGVMAVIVLQSDVFGHAVTDEVCERWIESVCLLSSAMPVDTSVGSVHLVVSGSWFRPDDAAHDDGLPVQDGGYGHTHTRYLGQGLGETDVWAAHYRADMAAAAKVLAATDVADGWMHGGQRGGRGTVRDQLVLDWQPVCHATEPGLVLYFDACPRFLNARGRKTELAGERQALERIGLSGLLDCFLVGQTVSELENDPDVVLSVTISAQSASDMPWWRDVRSRLEDNPGLARRLVIAVTDTSALPDISEASRFISVMQRLGCAVAIDDFGLGHASIRQLVALSPDIVRIGHFFLEWAARSPDDRGVFMHLAGLARALVPVVIVDGVENAQQSQIALDAGVCWQQGALWGEAGSVRMWLAGSVRMWHSPHALGAARSDPIFVVPSVQRGRGHGAGLSGGD